MTLKKFLNNFEEYFCVWTLAIMTIVVFVQVVMRYVFANSLSWSEELARFTMTLSSCAITLTCVG